jgi:hypothetical protein
MLGQKSNEVPKSLGGTIEAALARVNSRSPNKTHVVKYLTL